MEVLRSKNFKDAIVHTQILDDGRLLIVDAKSTVRYLDLQTLELLDGFKANIHHLRYKNKVIEFSSDGKYFAILKTDSKESRLYNTKTKKVIVKVDRHHGEASCVGIDPHSKYMFSCGDDGKTFVMDIQSGKLVFTLPMHIDAVNDIVFSCDGNLVATCSYDKKISLFNLTMMTQKYKLKAHSDPVMKMTFIGHNRFFSVDKNNQGIIWNLRNAKVITRLDGIHDDVTQVITAEENQFLFLATALGYVLVYDLKTYEQLSKKYIKVGSSITSLVFDEKSKELILSCNDGNVSVYNIYEGEEHINTLLREQRYEDIQAYVDVNPLLEYTEIHSRVANLWQNTLAKAKLHLQKGDKKTAIALLGHFKNVPAKNKIMQEIILEYADYDKFVDVAKGGKLLLAYGLANQHPMYKETPIYKSLEQRWKKAFALAQKHALDPKGMDTAREILAPYRGISDKTKLIQDLFAQAEVYKRFKIALGQKDFKITFELIKLHPFLMEFPEYTTIMNYGDTLYIKSQEFLNVGDTHSAIKMIRILVDFPDFAAEVKEMMLDIESKQKFFKAVKDEDIVTAYNMLDISADLQDTEDGKRLQEEWNKDLAVASAHAVEGDAAGIERALSSYMMIRSKYRALATVFGWCYMVQLEQAVAVKKDKFLIEEGIKNYILNFGLEDQILSLYEIFIKKFPSSKLNLELLTKGSLSMWRPSMIVESILD
ncbi:MAG: WD40 repeat domain-containing protein [Helicobacteraceae bacterium]|nr:WD40 repeat domain-containing protein [Candidatus Sulfurimonas ponti]MBL6972840.1 WD40 repeat domain-containing protein [Sulfurimonas sp.]